MSKATEARHPIWGNGVASGPVGHLALVCALGVALLIGMGLGMTSPLFGVVLVIAIAAIVMATHLSYAAPVAVLAGIIVAQVLVPVYIRIPAPVLSAFPLALSALFGFAALLVLRGILAPNRTRQAAEVQLMATALLIFAGVVAVSMIGPNLTAGGVAMYVKTVAIPLLLFFVTIRVLRNGADLDRVFCALAVAAILCAVLGLVEFITLQNIVADLFAPEISPEEDIFLWLLTQKNKADLIPDMSVYRVFSFFTQPLEYATFMVMILPYFALRFATAQTAARLLIWGGAGALVLAGFLVSFSRGPTLALGAVLLVLAVLETRLVPWLLASAFAGLLGVLAFWQTLADALGHRLSSTENVTVRFGLWENGLQLFAAHPIRGIGYGAYPDLHVDTLRENRIGPMYEYSWERIESITTVENLFITFAAETGILGLGAFLMVIGINLWLTRRALTRARCERDRLLVLAALGAVLAYLLSGMTVANNVGYTITVLFLGVILTVAPILAASRAAGEART